MTTNWSLISTLDLKLWRSTQKSIFLSAVLTSLTLISKLFSLNSLFKADLTTLFLYISNEKDKDILLKTFSKSLYKLLNIKLFDNKNSFYSIDKQISILSIYKILPLQLRQFQHMSKFIFSILQMKQKCILKDSVLAHKRLFMILRNPFVLPAFKTDVYKFSFLNISLNLLNKFLYNMVVLKKNQISLFYSINTSLSSSRSLKDIGLARKLNKLSEQRPPISFSTFFYIGLDYPDIWQ